MRLINKNDILKVRQISKSIPEERINTFIDEAQILDLKPILGEAFYFDIITNPDNYSDLLNGKVYQYGNNTVSSCGLKQVLIFFTYARYKMFGNEVDTPFGFTEKQFQDGKNPERSSKKENYKYNQQTAFQYWEEVQKYLNRNSNLYPLWKTENCITKRNNFFRINKISR